MSDLEQKNPGQAAPKNWLEIVNRCNLDNAFNALDGWNHFHTDTLRGRTRSLQLRPKEAWKYFHKAETLADKYENSEQNILRRFILKIYCFENALTEESLPNSGNPSRTKEYLQEVLEFNAPDTELVRNYKKLGKGLYLLHRQNYAASKKIFNHLIHINKNRMIDEKTGFYLVAAVAHRGLGEEEESDRQLENACLAIPTLKNTYNMGLYAGVTIALLRLWDRKEEAKEWDDFLVNLKIPKKTANLFRERSRRILERSASLNRVFIF